MNRLLTVVFLVSTTAFGNPHPDPKQVPQVEAAFWVSPETLPPLLSADAIRDSAIDILRVRFDWHADNDTFTVASLLRESSGTPALLARAKTVDALGSYRALLYDLETDELLGADAVGTGQNFRFLTRSLSFRFPWTDRPAKLVLVAENPTSGVMETVLTEEIQPSAVLRTSNARLDDLEVRVVKEATMSPALHVNIYAEGYSESGRDGFWGDADRVKRVFERNQFPYWEHVTIRAVFSPSRQSLGDAENLGLPVPERDSFLGLYYPYWNNFGRWYHVVYPTREERFRAAIGLVPYDYPIAMIDSNAYWGVGNYKEHTAIPSRNSSFEYLLMHEFGHFLGLNEEYEGGGRTELEFAPGIEEPWSQNITFLRDPANLKWSDVVTDSLPIPTPSRYWQGNGPLGAYQGGYADSTPHHASHKPGFACTMNSGDSFCQVCEDAIRERVAADLGL